MYDACIDSVFMYTCQSCYQNQSATELEFAASVFFRAKPRQPFYQRTGSCFWIARTLCEALSENASCSFLLTLPPAPFTILITLLSLCNGLSPLRDLICHKQCGAGLQATFMRGTGEREQRFDAWTSSWFAAVSNGSRRLHRRPYCCW